MRKDIPLHEYQREVDRASAAPSALKLGFRSQEIESEYLLQLSATHIVGKQAIALVALFCLFLFGVWELIMRSAPISDTVLMIRLVTSLPLCALICVLYLRPQALRQQELISLTLISISLGGQFGSLLNDDNAALPGIITLVFCNTLIFLLTGLLFWRKLVVALIMNLSHFAILVYFDVNFGLVLISMMLQGVFVIAGLYHSLYVERIARENFLRGKLLTGLTALETRSGLWNRHNFDQHLTRLLGRANQEQVPFVLGILDVDEFRAYNEHYGHLAGDECLSRIDQVLKHAECSENDLVVRFGGKEFILVLWDVSIEQAHQRLENMLHAVRKLRIPHTTSSVRPYVTASIGVGVFDPAAPSKKYDLLQLADRYLQLAKHSGRDCVQSAQRTISSVVIHRAS